MKLKVIANPPDVYFLRFAMIPHIRNLRTRLPSPRYPVVLPRKAPLNNNRLAHASQQSENGAALGVPWIGL